jgi:hypothetical protein
VVFIAVLFVGLRNDPASRGLLLALIQHVSVLGAVPILKRREGKPFRSAVLMHVVNGMTGGKMVIRVPSHQLRSHLVSPLIVAEAVEVVP